VPASEPSSPAENASNARSKYYEALLSRFENLREQLVNPPPSDSVEKLDQSHPTVMLGNTADWKAWKWRIGNTDPWPAQLAKMDRVSVLKVLKLISSPGGFMQGRGKGIDGRTSRWIWGLLARLPDRGEMGSEDVGVARELGKKAILVGTAFAGGDTSYVDDGEDEQSAEVIDTVIGQKGEYLRAENQAQNNIEDKQMDTDTSTAPIIGPVRPIGSDMVGTETSVAVEAAAEDDPEALAAARQRMLERLQAQTDQAEEFAINIEPDVPVGRSNAEEDDANVRINTRATVDMIITVVGELYGQRDLLEYRQLWD
jgi:hypothetical protein